MRLIDADLLDEVLDDKFEGCYALDVNYIQDDIIPNIPTVDAVPRELYESMEYTCYKLQQALSESWIPCSERLPTCDDGDGVLVSTAKAFGESGEVISVWTSSVELYYQKGWVTAWMPLPKPYTETKGGTT